MSLLYVFKEYVWHQQKRRVTDGQTDGQTDVWTTRIEEVKFI